MYTRILVPLDGSSTSSLALDHALALARLTGAGISLLHILEEYKSITSYGNPKYYLEEIRPRILADAEGILSKAADYLKQEGVEVESTLEETMGKRISEIIAEHAETNRCDLIILGTHGRRGVNRLVIGSDAEQVARIAPVPVMLVREAQPVAGQEA